MQSSHIDNNNNYQHKQLPVKNDFSGSKMIKIVDWIRYAIMTIIVCGTLGTIGYIIYTYVSKDIRKISKNNRQGMTFKNVGDFKFGYKLSILTDDTIWYYVDGTDNIIISIGKEVDRDSEFYTKLGMSFGSFVGGLILLFVAYIFIRYDPTFSKAK